MKKVFIVHGFEGSPNGGWRPWLMSELALIDVYACALPMPSPEKPVVLEWVNTIKESVNEPHLEIFLVGHSLGVPAILRYLEGLPEGVKIGGAFLVSGPLHPIIKRDYESIHNFLVPSFNFPHIRNVCKNFVVLHGDDDPVVDINNAEDLSYDLSCNLIVIPNGKHLNGSAGWYEFPQLLKVIKDTI